MKKLLIVSPHFPPANAPDMQRVRMSLPYYRANGWEPVVLAVGDRWQEGVREAELLETIPADVRIVYTRAIPIRISRLLGIGTLGLRAWGFMFWTGSRLLRREKFDLVFFSNTQFFIFTLGPIWRRLFKLPYVLDVQDPWRTDYYERAGSRQPPGGWKYQFSRFIAWRFEAWCFQRASGVMSVSPHYLADLCRRYPRLSATPAAVIIFGASQADQRRAATLPPLGPTLGGRPGQIHLLYAGASGPVMPHALTVLFIALRHYRDRHPERASRIRLHFVGTSYVAPGKGKNSVLPVADECGVADLVEEIPHRLGYFYVLQLMQQADVLLLAGSSDLAYSPSKAYLYYLSRRPILGLVFRDSVLERILECLNCAYLVRIREGGPQDEGSAGLCRFFDLMLDGFPAGSLPAPNEEYFRDHFLSEELTREQCILFDRASASGLGTSRSTFIMPRRGDKSP